MCGRFTLTQRELGGIPVELSLLLSPEFQNSFSPQYNVAPTDAHWIIFQEEEQNRLEPAIWGLVPSWSENAEKFFINARAETAMEKPTFRKAFREGRCLVPVDGFYEWAGPKGRKQPVWFHLPQREAFLFAGLFERDPEDPHIRRFTILTTQADEAVRPIHHRMPVMLSLNEARRWITPHRHVSDLRELHQLVQRPTKMPISFEYVSKRVNDSSVNDDRLISSIVPS